MPDADTFTNPAFSYPEMLIVGPAARGSVGVSWGPRERGGCAARVMGSIVWPTSGLETQIGLQLWQVFEVLLHSRFIKL